MLVVFHLRFPMAGDVVLPHYRPRPDRLGKFELAGDDQNGLDRWLVDLHGFAVSLLRLRLLLLRLSWADRSWRALLDLPLFALSWRLLRQ